MVNILDTYVKKVPSDQNLLDIFKGEWSSQMPTDSGLVSEPGSAGLFNDIRITWADKTLGGFLGKKLLELGPLEGGHTYMLDRIGVKEIVSVEANTRAFLKCLIVKEIFKLKNSRFLLGDFVEYLEQSKDQYDAIIASGVLYHMSNPLRLLELISKHTDKVMLWTHYYDEAVIRINPALSAKFGKMETSQQRGVVIECAIQSYNEALNWNGFCGGSAPTSVWLTRNTLLEYLKALGFTHLNIANDDINHPNGPAFTVCAAK